MHQEDSFIPYSVSPLPPGPWLVFAPHADDETFGLGGSLLLAAEQGIATHVIVLTDGALGGDAEDLVAIRRREVASAAEFLKLASLECWDEADRGLQASPALINRCRDAITRLAPASVFFPGCFEPHPDHRATTQLVWSALQAMFNDGQAPLPQPIAYEIGVQSPINTLIDITPVAEGKARAIDLYNSQNDENDYPNLVAALNRARTFSLPDHVKLAEGLYCFNPADPARPVKALMDDYYAKYW